MLTKFSADFVLHCQKGIHVCVNQDTSSKEQRTNQDTAASSNGREKSEDDKIDPVMQKYMAMVEAHREKDKQVCILYSYAFIELLPQIWSNWMHLCEVELEYL